MPTSKKAAPRKKAPARKAAAREVVPGDDAGGSGSAGVGNEGTEDGERRIAAEAHAKRSAPPVSIPDRVTRTPGGPSRSVRQLQVALTDLGYYTGKVTGYYDQATRNAVSDLQVRLRTDGYLQAAPNGLFGDATREALRAHPDIATSD